jgi:DNA-damage-inducible protein J
MTIFVTGGTGTIGSPFEPFVPNEETIEAMKAARRGEVTTVGSPGKLLASLNADC